MKKFFISLVLMLLSVCRVFAYNSDPNFHYDLSRYEIAVEDINPYFWKFLEPAEGSDFVEIKNVVDTAGYQHIGYMQYLGGIPYPLAIVLVHAYQGKVLSMNGAILSQSAYDQQFKQPANISSDDAVRRVKKSAPVHGDGEMTYVHVLENGQYKAHKVYRVLAENMTEYIYVDVYTGEVVMRQKLVYSLDANCTVSTMYSSEQTIQCMKIDGNYVLRDEGRKIITLNATNAILEYPEDPNAMDAFYVKVQEYLAQCTDFSNATTDWGNAGGYKLCLDKITVLDVPAWKPMEGDSVLNLYLVISDGSGNVLETTACQEITSYPVTFTFASNVEMVDSVLNVSFRDHNDESEDTELVSLPLVNAVSNYEISRDDEDVKCIGFFNPVGCQPALDIHWGMEKTIDFYREVFHHDGPDGRGAPVVQLFNPRADNMSFAGFPFQAIALKSFAQPITMAYGMGGKTSIITTQPYVSLDVMAHEYTHHITNNNGTGGLIYMDEFGALNESFSDLMAMAVLQYATGSCKWTLGEDFLIDHNLRSISDPWQSGEKPQPKYYKGKYWAPLGDYSPTGDQGGVHTNSGVQNYWFYLLSEGGNGVNEVGEAYHIPALGIEKAARIAYTNLIYYITPYSDYHLSRWGSIQAARELYGAGSAEEIAVTDAWAAVGVGNKYGDPSDELDFLPGKYLVLNVSEDSEDLFLMSSYQWGTAESSVTPVPQCPMGVHVQDFDMEAKHYVTDFDPVNIWEVADDGLGYTLKSGDAYLGYTSSKTAELTAESKRLSIIDYGDFYRIFFTGDATKYYLVMNMEESNEYFDFRQSENENSHLMLIPLIDDTSDGCVATEQENVPVKILKDGRLLILHNDNTYTITGIKVE